MKSDFHGRGKNINIQTISGLHVDPQKQTTDEAGDRSAMIFTFSVLTAGSAIMRGEAVTALTALAAAAVAAALTGVVVALMVFIVVVVVL